MEFNNKLQPKQLDDGDEVKTLQVDQDKFLETANYKLEREMIKKHLPSGLHTKESYDGALEKMIKEAHDVWVKTNDPDDFNAWYALSYLSERKV